MFLLNVAKEDLKNLHAAKSLITLENRKQSFNINNSSNIVRIYPTIMFYVLLVGAELLYESRCPYV